jgi:hypothetical protein
MHDGPIKVAKRSKAWNVFVLLNTGIVADPPSKEYLPTV